MRSRTDPTNIKLNETPLDITPEQQERRLAPDHQLEDQAMDQREVTNRYAPPPEVAAGDSYRYLENMANDYFERLEGHSASSNQTPKDFVDTSKVTKKKRNQTSEEDYSPPRNQPLINDVPIVALLLSGNLPKRPRTRSRKEEQIVTGTIEDIDKKNGVIKLRTDSGFIELYILLPAVQDLLAKDTITVSVRPL
jgi:hypothetical protein